MLLSDYLQALRRGWAIFLVALLVALTAAAVLVARKADVYTSSTQLFVASASPTDDPEKLYESNQIALQRVKSYVALAGGDLVADRASELLGSDLDATVVVSIVPETVIVQVTASGADPEQVAAVAGAYAEVLPAAIDEVEDVGSSPVEVRVTVVDEADVPSAPDASSTLMPFVALGLLGLGVAFAIVMVREVLRRESAATSHPRNGG